MSKTTETGHSNNVANYGKLIANVTSLGAVYNPVKTSLKLNALNTQLAAAISAMDSCNKAMSVYRAALTIRDVAFEPFGTLVTRINNSLKASDSSEQIDETAMGLVRKLQGRRASPKKTEAEKKAATEDGKEVVEISSSRMSYDSRLDNFDKLIKLLSAVPAYNPNETELKVSSLTALCTDLKNKNSAVSIAEFALNNARIVRDDILYKTNTGLVDTSVDVKNYIKSVFGTTSPQYKSLSSLKFTNKTNK